ncbi:MAG: hypothetical protein ACYDHH_13760 [Solirubrobacteraceae bacterium]
MRARRGAVAALAAALALQLAGCGTSEHDQVQAKVQQLIKATAHKDYKTLCNQVLGPRLLSHLAAYGIPCVQAMAQGLQNVRQPQLAIGGIVINGNKASVTTITTAVGQQSSLRAIELVNTSNGWRVENLGSPVFPRKG